MAKKLLTDEEKRERELREINEKVKREVEQEQAEAEAYIKARLGEQESEKQKLHKVVEEVYSEQKETLVTIEETLNENARKIQDLNERLEAVKKQFHGEYWQDYDLTIRTYNKMHKQLLEETEQFQKRILDIQETLTAIMQEHDIISETQQTLAVMFAKLKGLTKEETEQIFDLKPKNKSKKRNKPKKPKKPKK